MRWRIQWGIQILPISAPSLKKQWGQHHQSTRNGSGDTDTLFCTLGVFSALAFAADFPPVAPEFHQRTHRVHLRNLGTTDKKSSRKIKYKKISRVHQSAKGEYIHDTAAAENGTPVKIRIPASKPASVRFHIFVFNCFPPFQIMYSRNLFVLDFARRFFVNCAQISEALALRPPLKFGCNWRKIGRKGKCRKDSESTSILSRSLNIPSAPA